MGAVAQKYAGMVIIAFGSITYNHQSAVSLKNSVYLQIIIELGDKNFAQRTLRMAYHIIYFNFCAITIRSFDIYRLFVRVIFVERLIFKTIIGK